MSALWWGLLVALSAAMTGLLGLAGCPASAFIGPMSAAVIMAGILERTPKIPAWSFLMAQGFIGALVARSLSAESWAALGSSWPFVFGGTLWGLGAGALSSLVLFRLKLLPGPSAFWCLSPGGAGVMVIMSGTYGADMRLVAFAQYYRVLLVSLMAITVSATWLAGPGGPAPPTIFFPRIDPASLAVTVAAVLTGYGVARLVPIPGGLLLLPMFAAVLFSSVFHAPVTLPPWIMYPCYALVGWRIGLTFTRSILVAIFRLILPITAAILAMVIGCAIYSLVLWRGLGLSPLTAYLASCPGGLDAVTIIASGSDADLAFVMTMQAMRLLVVILSGPWLYSWLTRRYGFQRVDSSKSASEPDEKGSGPSGGASGSSGSGSS